VSFFSDIIFSPALWDFSVYFNRLKELTDGFDPFFAAESGSGKGRISKDKNPW